jgi:hypothetical protein
MRRALVEVQRKVKAHSQTLPHDDEGSSLIKSVVIDGRDNYTFDELDKQPIYIIG